LAEGSLNDSQEAALDQAYEDEEVADDEVEDAEEEFDDAVEDEAAAEDELDTAEENDDSEAAQEAEEDLDEAEEEVEQAEEDLEAAEEDEELAEEEETAVFADAASSDSWNLNVTESTGFLVEITLNMPPGNFLDESYSESFLNTIAGIAGVDSDRIEVEDFFGLEGEVKTAFTFGVLPSSNEDDRTSLQAVQAFVETFNSAGSSALDTYNPVYESSLKIDSVETQICSDGTYQIYCEDSSNSDSSNVGIDVSTGDAGKLDSKTTVADVGANPVLIFVLIAGILGVVALVSFRCMKGRAKYDVASSEKQGYVSEYEFDYDGTNDPEFEIGNNTPAMEMSKILKVEDSDEEEWPKAKDL